MEWEAIAAVAETLSAVGVVVTLAYFALQIRQNRKAIDSQVDQNAWSQYNACLSITAASLSASEVVTRGLRSTSELSEAEKYQFMSLLTLAFNSAEHHLRQLEFADSNEGDGAMIWNIVSNYLLRQGGEEWWAEHKGFYTKKFIDWVEENRRRHVVESD